MNKSSQDKKSTWSFKKMFSRKDDDYEEEIDLEENQKEISLPKKKSVFENGDLVSKDGNVAINWSKTYKNLIDKNFTSLQSINSQSLNECLVYKAYDNNFVPEFTFDFEFINDDKTLVVKAHYLKDTISHEIIYHINDINRKEFDYQKMVDVFCESNKTVEELHEMDFDEFLYDEIDNDYYVTIVDRNISENELEIRIDALRSFGILKNNTFKFQHLKIDASSIRPNWNILFLVLKDKNVFLEDLNEDVVKQNITFSFGKQIINKFEYDVKIEKDFANCQFAATIIPINAFNEIYDNNFVCNGLKMSSDSVTIDEEATIDSYLSYKNSITLFNFDVNDFASHIVYYFRDQKFVNVSEGVFANFKVRARALFEDNYKNNTITILVSNDNFVDKLGQPFKKDFQIRNIKFDLSHIKFNLSSFATNIKWKNKDFFEVDEDYLNEILNLSEITYHNVPLNEELNKLVSSIFKVQILEKDFEKNLFKIKIYVDKSSPLLPSTFINEYSEQIFFSQDLTRMTVTQVIFNEELTNKAIQSRILDNNTFDKIVGKFVSDQIFARDNSATIFFKEVIKLNIFVQGTSLIIENPDWLELINIDHRIDKYSKKFVELTFEALNLLKPNGQTFKFILVLRFNPLMSTHPFVTVSFKEF